MRGTPFVQTILMVAVFLLAGWPVYRLTRPAGAASAAASANPEETPAADTTTARPAPLEVEVVFAPAPADFELKNLDQTVLAGHGPQARFTTRWAAAVPPEGVDLVLQAHWSAQAAGGSTAPGTPPGVNPAAAQVTVRFADGRQVEKSFWAAANGALSDVFTIPGETPATTP